MKIRTPVQQRVLAFWEEEGKIRWVEDPEIAPVEREFERLNAGQWSLRETVISDAGSRWDFLRCPGQRPGA